MSAWSIVLVAAALGAGLMAGLFFVFSVAVMDALGRVPARGGIAAMQAINHAIVNSRFLAAFVGTGVVCLALAVHAIVDWDASESPWILTGGVLYLTGGILVTMVCNVPMNDQLASIDPDDPEALRVWARYLDRWTAWNHVRTVACLTAAGLLTLALAVQA